MHLKEAVEKGLLPRPTQLIASPKIRAVQTLSPTARFLSLPLVKSDDLDERAANEDMISFKKRISKMIESFFSINSSLTSKDVVFLCSHLDWLEEFSNLVPCDTDLHQISGFQWDPCAYLIFEIQTIWHLTNSGAIKGGLI